MAGIDIPNQMQGLSMKPILQNKTKNWRDALYYHYYEYPGIHMVKRHYGIRTDRYKLIRFYYDIEAWELYDLLEDPQELYNVYNNPKYETIQQRLHKRLEELRTQYQDNDSLNQRFIQNDLARMRKLGYID